MDKYELTELLYRAGNHLFDAGHPEFRKYWDAADKLEEQNEQKPFAWGLPREFKETDTLVFKTKELAQDFSPDKTPFTLYCYLPATEAVPEDHVKMPENAAAVKGFEQENEVVL